MAGIRAWAAAHRKLAVFAAGAALTVAVQVWGTSNPYVSLAILIVTGGGVYQAPNVTIANPTRLVRDPTRLVRDPTRLVTAPPADPGPPPATRGRKP